MTGKEVKMKPLALLSSLSAMIILGGWLNAAGQTDMDRLADLKTIRHDLDIKVDYEAEKVFGRSGLTVHNSGPSTFSPTPTSPIGSFTSRARSWTSVASNTGWQRTS
jgi:hypothetical protein